MDLFVQLCECEVWPLQWAHHFLVILHLPECTKHCSFLMRIQTAKCPFVRPRLNDGFDTVLRLLRPHSTLPSSWDTTNSMYLDSGFGFVEHRKRKRQLHPPPSLYIYHFWRQVCTDLFEFTNRMISLPQTLASSVSFQLLSMSGDKVFLKKNLNSSVGNCVQEHRRSPHQPSVWGLEESDYYLQTEHSCTQPVVASRDQVAF